MHFSENGRNIIVFFNDFFGYNDIEVVYEKFKHNLLAKVYDKVDGPYSIIWKIIIQDEEFKLVVDEIYGVMLIAETPSAIQKAKELLKNIEKFIQ